MCWLPLAATASTVRTLLGTSHKDLHLRSQKLSHTLGGTFFDRDTMMEGAFFVSARGGSARFLEDGLYVCPELLPLWPALMVVQRALLQVVV
jgi:hypothetical protein